MPNYRRDQTPGATWFFTVVSFNRSDHLCLEPVRMALRNAILRVRQKYPFGIDAWVLLPDHFHCLWTLPDNDVDYSLRMGLIKRHVTRACREIVPLTSPRGESRRRHREQSFWQRRFWEHRIRDKDDFANHIDYIHFNPVKHGLCLAPSAWPYSSLHRYIARGVFPQDWAANPEQTGSGTGMYGEA